MMSIGEKEISRLRRLLPPRIASHTPRRIAVVAISEKEAARLNMRFRKIPKPANVLSFRYGNEYGEILVCPAVVRRDAVLQKHTFRFQMTWMVLHGILHLAGMHHEKSLQWERRVETIEKEVLSCLFP